MRRRGSIFGGGFLFIGIILFSLVGDIVEFLVSFLPLIIIGYIVFGLINKKSNYQQTQTTYSKPKEEASYSHLRKQEEQVLSNGELNKIDNKLNAYFKKNVDLPIVDDIGLTTQNGKFVTAEQLYLTYKGEKIVKLSEFKNKNAVAFNKIMNLLLIFSKQKDIVVNKEQKEEPKVDNTLSEAEEYIDKIDKLNKAIPQEEITNGLYQTCDLLKHIDVLKETTNDESKIKKLYDYYLPILTNILEEYKKLQDAPVHGDEFKNCEKQLIKTITLINEALKAICASMQENDYMNINADINTLQSLLEKDGYGKDPFNGEKK